MKLGMHLMQPSFQINPHWISNSGLWKVVLETCRGWPGKLTKGVPFHQDNAPAHKSLVAMAAVHDCGFELGDHPPFFHPSSDLAPSNYFLFPNMKKLFAGKQNWTDDEVISAVEDLKTKSHLIKFDHCVIVSLWIFSPHSTIVYVHLEMDSTKEFHLTPYINIKGPCKSEDVPHLNW